VSSAPVEDRTAVKTLTLTLTLFLDLVALDLTSLHLLWSLSHEFALPRELGQLRRYRHLGVVLWRLKTGALHILPGAFTIVVRLLNRRRRWIAEQFMDDA